MTFQIVKGFPIPLPIKSKNPEIEILFEKPSLYPFSYFSDESTDEKISQICPDIIDNNEPKAEILEKKPRAFTNQVDRPFEKTEEAITQIIKTSLTKNEKKVVQKQESFDDLLKKLESNPALLLELDGTRWDNKQLNMFAKTALITVALEKKFQNSQIYINVKNKAEEILPKEPSIIKNYEELEAHKEAPSFATVVKHGSDRAIDFYEKNLNLSCEQILSLLELLKSDCLSEKLAQAAYFAAKALIPIPSIASKIAKGMFGDTITMSLVYGTAFHPKNIDVFKVASAFFPSTILLAHRSIKKSPELKECWLRAGTTLKLGKEFIYKDDRFPKDYKEEILNSYDLLLKGIKTDPSILFNAGKKITNNKELYILLIKNALALLILNPEAKELFGQHKQPLLDLAKKQLPSTDSKVKNQEALNLFLKQNPKINDGLTKGATFPITKKWKTEYLNCSYAQYVISLCSLFQLFSTNPSEEVNLVKNFAFISVIDVEEAVRAVLTNFPKCGTVTRQVIVQQYSKHEEIVELAVQDTLVPLALYFADESIRSSEMFKPYLTELVTYLLKSQGLEIFKLPNFPKYVLDDPEILTALIKINPKVIKLAKEEVVRKIDLTSIIQEGIKNLTMELIPKNTGK